MKIKLSEIKGTESKRDHGNINELVESIKKEGLLEPLVVNQNNELICGRRRFEALTKLGYMEIEVNKIKTVDDIDMFSKAICENVQRKNLTWQEEIEARGSLEQLRKERFGITKHGGDRKSSSLNELEIPTLKDIAKETKQSVGKISQDIQLAKALKEYPQLGKVKTKTGALIEFKKIKDREQIKTLTLPKGLFQVIVIDPPWEVFYNPEGRRGGAKYPTMTIQELKNIKLPYDKNCVLWLWAINKYLHEAFHILEEWKFEYKNIFTWIKPQLGLGDWGRTQTEHILLATKGKPILELRNQKNIIEANRQGHSEKPQDFYDMVNRTCNGNKLDYFARKERKGWSVYGTVEK